VAVPAADINRFPAPRAEENNDCAIVSLSVYTGKSYEDVLREVTLVDKRNKGRAGLWTRQIKQVARKLGCPLRSKKRRDIDWEHDYGMLLLDDHVCVLRNGLVLETNGGIWDVHQYLREGNDGKPVKVESILMAK
jgi:hypothetical protein